MILDIGDVAEISAAVTNGETSESVDPTSPKFRVTTPSGDTEDVTATKLGTGRYGCEYPCGESGLHQVLFIGTGTNAVAGEVQFRVRRPRVPRGT